ncbi:MAG TPA: TIGR03557 family F420-dependent LLM class oxidoreductase [Actinomycetota bacterium]|nr:TIGR03557 family F420-dependent LLM class oxidoreductase [Actinomycetota bacterium]
MTDFGYKLSSEEHHPRQLVANARRAEEAGFSFAAISDHFHPWVTAQGHSPFVWSVLGGIAQATERIEILTGVTCPTFRTHPAIIAHAAATAGAMLPGRFALGVGSGENLNEHILGQRWPEAPVRLAMLEEAVEVIRKLWKGSQVSHHGEHYTVENARIFDLPDQPIPIMVAGSGDTSVKLAARIGDGFVGLAPSSEMLETFDASGGKGKPRYCEVNVCWAEDVYQARSTVMEYWPVAGIKGQLMQELPLPALFEQASSMVAEDDVVETIVCGPDDQEHIEGITKFIEAGYDHVWIHQIGPDQEGFMRFYEDRVLPKLS